MGVRLRNNPPQPEPLGVGGAGSEFPASRHGNRPSRSQRKYSPFDHLLTMLVNLKSLGPNALRKRNQTRNVNKFTRWRGLYDASAG